MPASWTPQHDVAHLYLFLAADADRDLHAAEVELLRQRLAGQAGSAAAADQIIAEVVTALQQAPRHRSALQAAENLKYATLTDDDRRLILRDLTAIARADGAVHVNEHAFLFAVARLWGLPLGDRL